MQRGAGAEAERIALVYKTCKGVCWDEGEGENGRRRVSRVSFKTQEKREEHPMQVEKRVSGEQHPIAGPESRRIETTRSWTLRPWHRP